MKEYNGKKLITMKDWTESFDKIAEPGDFVEEDIVDSFINCVPPVCLRSDCTQCGEPYSYEEDPVSKTWKPTYTTFKRVTVGIYVYCGTCFYGENERR